MDGRRHSVDGLVMYDRAVAYVWLGLGAKYAASRMASDFAHPGEWTRPIGQVLDDFGVDLRGIRNLPDAIYALRGRFEWDSDPLLGLIDYVKPPARTLAERAGDCEDAAWLHAQVIEHVLGPLGWEGRIVSYLASDWTQSHHFAIAIDPGGGVWPVQPPPAKWQPAIKEYVWRYPRKSAEHAAREVAATYPGGPRVVVMDVRDASWKVKERWRRL